jgi:hypothetical protein
MLPRPRPKDRGLAMLCRTASPMTRANRDVHLAPLTLNCVLSDISASRLTL